MSPCEAITNLERVLNATFGLRIPNPNLLTRFSTSGFFDDMPFVLLHAPHCMLMVKSPEDFAIRAHASNSLFAEQ